METILSKVPESVVVPQSGDDWRNMLEGTLRAHARGINGMDVWDDLGFDSGSFPLNPVGAIAAPSRDIVLADFPGSLLFSGTLDNAIANSFQMPHMWKEGTQIFPHIHWTKPAGGAGDDVVWHFYYRVYKIGAAPTAWNGPILGTLAQSHNGIAEAEAITTFGPIAMSGYKISQNVAWYLVRKGSTDGFGGTARLIQFDVHFLKNTDGSRKEFTK